MKKVVKVSIGNLAFTIDEDGYELLKSYLGELNAHYKLKQNGDEIIEGIEERMAELFMEKSGKDVVISMQVVKDVINILGRPEIIDEETGTSTSEADQERVVRTPIPKRVYRDPDNKVFGGVCSGLGIYFNIDTVLVRILFVLFFIGFSVLGFHVGGGGFMIITYIILWIVIPEAKTVEQRCAMRGESPDLSHIQRRVEDGLNQVGSGIKRAGSQGGAVIADIFKKVLGIFLVFFSVSGVLCLTFFFLGAEILEGVLPFDVIDYVYIGFSTPFWLKTSLLLFMFLPLIGMLYGGIQLLFNFKSPKCRPGLIIFLLWIVSGISLTFLSVKASRPYWNEASESMTLPLRSDLDTLYLRYESTERMPDSKVFFDADRSDMVLFWVDGGSNNHDLVTFPKVSLVRQSEEDSSRIYLDVHAMAYSYAEAMMKAQKNPPTVELKDSLLIIHADTYSKANKWSGTCKEISIYLPEKVKVILEEPIRHDFDSDLDHHMDWNWHWHNDWD